MLLKKDQSKGLVFFLEQGTGVEPASEAWEATIIADILTLRDGMDYSIARWKMQAEMFDGVRGLFRCVFHRDGLEKREGLA